MQPNRPTSSSGGGETSRVSTAPSRVVETSWRLAPLHSRRQVPAKRGGEPGDERASGR